MKQNFEKLTKKKSDDYAPKKRKKDWSEERTFKRNYSEV